MSQTQLKIGIFGHYGNHNLGDEATIEAVVQNLRQRLPEAKLYGFSVVPSDTSQRYNVPAYGIRYTCRESLSSEQSERVPLENAERNAAQQSLEASLKTLPVLSFALKAVLQFAKWAGQLSQECKFLWVSHQRLKGFRLLLIAGSNQFLDDFGGTWGFPYTLLKWSILAKLAGAKLAFASVGAGPLELPLSRLLVRTALLFSDYTSFRDAASKRLIETTGFRDKGEVYPDLAHALVLQASPPPTPESELPVVGINPMPVYDPRYWCLPDRDKYHGYVVRLAAFVSALLREGYPVRFFNTMPKDENVICDVLASLAPDVIPLSDGAITLNRSVAELMVTYASFDLVIATRFHGILLSLLAERPVLGICYYRKSRDLLLEAGQGDYAVDLDVFTPEDLMRRFKALAAHRFAELAKIRKKNAENRDALHRQFDFIAAKLNRDR
ncbi:MAG: polysaccharide pyruvyl transferase family protein [Gammaproteobacteria bacterium]